MQSSYNLDQPMIAVAPMEDSLIDVVVMHLILNKVAEDVKQRRMKKSLADWLRTAHLLTQSPGEWQPEWIDETSRN